MERIENTGFGDIKLLQDSEGFRYGVDAVILADFAYSIYPQFKKAVDLGTGNGIIPFILSHKNREAEITGIDVQQRAVELARQSCRLNNLDDRISFIKKDISLIEKEELHAFCADMVVTNPPYFKRGGAIPSADKAKFTARHETTATVEDFIRAASYILNKGGHFFMVHRPSRLVDIFYYCRKFGLEPKHMRPVVPRAGKAANIVLIHCFSGGGKELKMMKELCIYGEDGQYSSEIQKIYERQNK